MHIQPHPKNAPEPCYDKYTLLFGTVAENKPIIL